MTIKDIQVWARAGGDTAADLGDIFDGRIVRAILGVVVGAIGCIFFVEGGKKSGSTDELLVLFRQIVACRQEMVGRTVCLFAEST